MRTIIKISALATSVFSAREPQPEVAGEEQRLFFDPPSSSSEKAGKEPRVLSEPDPQSSGSEEVGKIAIGEEEILHVFPEVASEPYIKIALADERNTRRYAGFKLAFQRNQLWRKCRNIFMADGFSLNRNFHDQESDERSPVVELHRVESEDYDLEFTGEGTIPSSLCGDTIKFHMRFHKEYYSTPAHWRIEVSQMRNKKVIKRSDIWLENYSKIPNGSFLWEFPEVVGDPNSTKPEPEKTKRRRWCCGSNKAKKSNVGVRFLVGDHVGDGTSRKVLHFTLGGFQDPAKPHVTKPLAESEIGFKSSD